MVEMPKQGIHVRIDSAMQQTISGRKIGWIWWFMILAMVVAGVATIVRLIVSFLRAVETGFSRSFWEDAVPQGVVVERT